jgi:hypothetical protein
MLYNMGCIYSFGNATVKHTQLSLAVTCVTISFVFLGSLEMYVYPRCAGKVQTTAFSTLTDILS